MGGHVAACVDRVASGDARQLLLGRQSLQAEEGRGERKNQAVRFKGPALTM